MRKCDVLNLTIFFTTIISISISIFIEEDKIYFVNMNKKKHYCNEGKYLLRCLLMLLRYLFFLKYVLIVIFNNVKIGYINILLYLLSKNEENLFFNNFLFYFAYLYIIKS
jgi:hypothetical protein